MALEGLSINQLLIAITAIAAPVATYLFGSKRGRKATKNLESELRDVLSEYGVPDAEQTQIEKAQLEAAVRAVAPDDADLEFHTLDGTYYAPDPSSIALVRNVASVLSFLPYRPERYDCEDFAKFGWVLPALFLGVNSVGFVIDYSGGHAYNVIVDSQGDAIFFESQTGDVVRIGSEDKYSLERGEVLF
jgi:hypothetical protein